MFENIMKVISAATPFLLLFMGWMYTSATSKRDKREEANKKTVEEKEKARKEQLDNQTKKIDDLIGDISDLKKDMAHYHQVDRDTIKNINALANAGEITSTKLSELASVVMVLAEGLRDQHLDGNITKAVEKYRKYESDTSNAMLHGVFTDAKSDGVSK